MLSPLSFWQIIKIYFCSTAISLSVFAIGAAFLFPEGNMDHISFWYYLVVCLLIAEVFASVWMVQSLIFWSEKNQEDAAVQHNAVQDEIINDDTAQRVSGETRQLSAVFGGMTEGVIAIDADEKIIFANDAAHRIIEFNFREATGKRIWEAIRNTTVQNVVREILSGKEQVRAELELPRTQSVMELLASRLPGTPCPGMVLMLHDVTELRRLENLRRNFVSNVSHELKTPLASIQAHSETLLEGALDDPEVGYKFVKRITEQADRLHALIQDILQLSRIESKQRLYELETVDVKHIFEQVIADHRYAIELRSSDVQMEFPDGALTVLAESDALKTVVGNLLSNALNYSPEKSKIILRAQLGNNLSSNNLSGENLSVQIECQDFGVGIPESHLERVFERFYRVDAARSRDVGGTGLGLSIVKHIVQELGGTVAVKSKQEEGSTFTITFPSAMS